MVSRLDLYVFFIIIAMPSLTGYVLWPWPRVIRKWYVNVLYYSIEKWSSSSTRQDYGDTCYLG